MTFESFNKIARLNREVVITEKIDGTNAQVFIDVVGAVPMEDWISQGVPFVRVEHDGTEFVFVAGSRSRWISPNDDNAGFARWAHGNANELVKLGPGRHFGEWWGQGIQRGYGLKEKRWSLFNTSRWTDERPACCDVVPILWSGNFNTAIVEGTIEALRVHGSKAAPGFMRPEGIVIYHTAARNLFKVTLEKDEEPKSKAA